MHALTATGLLSTSRTFSANDTILSTDRTIITTAGYSVTTEAAPATDRVVFIKNKSASAYSLIIFGGLKQFDGANTSFVLLPGEFVIMQYDGTAWWSIGGVGRRSARIVGTWARVRYASTTAEEVVFAITVPGLLMNATGMLCWEPETYHRNFEGTSNNITPRIKIGGATVWQPSTVAQGSGSPTRSWGAKHMVFKNEGAANANALHFSGGNINVDGSPTTGEGSAAYWQGGTANPAVQGRAEAINVNTAADFVISQTVQLDTSHADFWTDWHGGMIRYFPGV